jgi:hypothetical protein
MPLTIKNCHYFSAKANASSFNPHRAQNITITNPPPKRQHVKDNAKKRDTVVDKWIRQSSH